MLEEKKKMDPQDLKPEIGNFAAAALVSAHISNYATSSRSFNDPPFIHIHIFVTSWETFPKQYKTSLHMVNISFLLPEGWCVTSLIPVGGEGHLSGQGKGKENIICAKNKHSEAIFFFFFTYISGLCISINAVQTMAPSTEGRVSLAC